MISLYTSAVTWYRGRWKLKGEHQKVEEYTFLAKRESCAKDLPFKRGLSAVCKIRVSAGGGHAVADCFPGPGRCFDAEFLV